MKNKVHFKEVIKMKGLGRNPDSGFKEGDWLWCFHCERVFKWDGKTEDCAYPDCDGGAMDISKWEGETPELGKRYSF